MTSHHLASRPRRQLRALALAALAAELLALPGGVAGAAVAEPTSPPALRVVVSQALSAPFVIWRDGMPVEGLDLALVHALAEQLRTRVELQALPRARVEAALEHGEADLACNLQPGPRADTGLRWSAPLFELHLMLVGHVQAAPVDATSQLPAGTVVGTLQGQAYVPLDPLFSDGRLRRDDALSEERLLRKLSLNRHPYGLLSRQTLSWHADAEALAAIDPWRLAVGNVAYRCAVSPRARIEPRLVLEALEQLQLRGRIEHLLAAHTQPALAVVVSTQSSLRRITRQQLSELYTGQRQHLETGQPAAPLMTGGPERQQFLQAVLQISAGQYRSNWAGQQFGGRRTPPLELRDAESLKSHLQRHTDSIGFLPLSQVDASLRVIYMP
jgi:polar amino acid transport system substrate-binding protein